MLKYDQLDPILVEQITEDRKSGNLPQFAFADESAKRRNENKDHANLWRPTFIRDCEKILHSSYFDRYADKTQVFSFSKNDDITRRAQHVQLVSRIARNIGRVLNLNLDLIEAIALGHDIGHTPFGHAGERILDKLYFEHTGRSFQHNVHSVRVLDDLIPYNLTLQTLNGILCHNGELELSEYRPKAMDSFDQLDLEVESCYLDKSNNLKMIPSTLEGCVVRICDIIAYLGKDRQDAMIMNKICDDTSFPDGPIGATNAEIINNLTVNIIKNSYGKPYIKLDKEYFDALSAAKKANYELIYMNGNDLYESVIEPMMDRIYKRLRKDLMEKNKGSVIYSQHIDLIERSIYRNRSYLSDSVDQIVVDYIAGMTDDYFLELYSYLFPKSGLKIDFKGYF
ncbi:MAG: HD domain-containing protein [Clostridia bacterium]|nr:HD domain-containing protein [Clostridia bacterium]